MASAALSPHGTRFAQVGYCANQPWLSACTNQLWANGALLSHDVAGRLTRQAFGWVSNGTFVTVTTNSFTYNAAGDVLSLADGLGHTTRWAYGPFGHAWRKTNAAAALVWTNGYNATGS